MSEGLGIVRVLEGVIRAHVRHYGGEPSLLIIGSADVPWLHRELGELVPHPAGTTFQGIELRKVDHATGAFGVGKLLARQLIDAGIAHKP